MRHIPDIVLFAVAATFALMFLGMLFVGIRRGEMGYEPGSPRVPFASRPVAFVALCIFDLALGSGAVAVAVFIVHQLVYSA